MRRVFRRGAMITAIAVVTLLVLAFAAGCAKPVSNTYAIVFKNTGNPYGDKQMSGFEAGIKEQGFQAILRAPDQPTAEGQIAIIEQLIAQHVAAICIVGNDKDALQPVLTKAKPGDEPEPLDRLHEEGPAGPEVREPSPREDRLR